MATNVKPKIKGKYKVKLNSLEKIEELCQIILDEASQVVVSLQDELNKLKASTCLNDCTVDERAKYSKAMKDYYDAKMKAIAFKKDVANLMTEITKHNGNVNNAAVQENIPMDWDALKESMKEDDNSIQEYTIGR